MRVLVTAGGTVEPIDDVRVIANTSTGRLGARIVDALASDGHDVVHLRGRRAVTSDAAADVEVFDTSADLASLLEARVPGVDAVVHAAAVADYLPVRSAGKLSSDADELVLRMRRAPKLIDRLRDLNPPALLVGFKLTSGLGEEACVAAARSLLERARLDWVVANEAAAIGDDDHLALLVSARGVERRVRGKTAIAAALADLLRVAAEASP